MKNKRLNAIVEKMKKDNISKMLVSDPYSIYYLTEKFIEAGERFLVLYIDLEKNVKLFVNELFPQEDTKDFEIIYYNDVDNPTLILSKYLNQNDLIGVDKKWPAKFLLSLQDLLKDAKFVNGSYIIDKIRQIKDYEEQELMRKSSLINDKVMEELISYVSKGLTEKELSSKVKELYEKHGVYEFSFQPITAYGKNGADPHHSTDNSKGNLGDSVVLDIGGIYKGYCSDMTRTVFIGKISQKQREVYEIVKNANLEGIKMARAGKKMSDVDKACRSYIEKRGYGKYFTHRTGHSIGLEAHEAGDVSMINDEIIKVGQVFSIEPGIYLPEENFGVRVEDLVLITEDSCEVLNKFSKDLIIVE